MATDRPDAEDQLPESHEDPADRTVPNPTTGATLQAFALLAVPTILVNVLIRAIATAAGASMEVDIGTATASVGYVPIVLVTGAALLSATVVWAVAAHRSPGFASLWVSLGWGVGLVSLAAIIGVSDLGTGIGLALMHLVTTVAAAHALPRILPRHATHA